MRLISAQPLLRDQCCLRLAAQMGLRRNELRLVQVGDIDLTQSLLTVHGKGGKVVVLPIGFPSLRDALYLHINGDARAPNEFLLYPKTSRTRPMTGAAVHNWFKRCLEQAGLPASVKLHEMRHSAADEIWRVTGDIVKAQQLLRHESVGTTQAYLHPHRDDLRKAMQQVEDAWERGDS
jgi:site-specific recombinase XerD